MTAAIAERVRGLPRPRRYLVIMWHNNEYCRSTPVEPANWDRPPPTAAPLSMLVHETSSVLLARQLAQHKSTKKG